MAKPLHSKEEKMVAYGLKPLEDFYYSFLTAKNM